MSRTISPHLTPDVRYTYSCSQSKEAAEEALGALLLLDLVPRYFKELPARDDVARVRAARARREAGKQSSRGLRESCLV